MLFQVLLAALVTLSAADNQPIHPQPSYNEPKHEEPAHYNYGYNVQDDYSGVNFNANENRDGYATNGQYQILLPDGRTQTVTYNVADGYSGYVAEVQYSGEAHYDAAPKHQPQPASYKPQPAHYNPSP